MSGRNLIIAVIIVFWTATVSAQSDWTRYTENDGLPQNRIGSIRQDSRGFIWVTTQNGAARFDGYTFTSFLDASSSLSVRNSRIRQMEEDNAGFIWFLSFNGEVYRFDPQTESFQNISETILQHTGKEFTTNRITISRTGAVWLLSSSNGCVLVNEAEPDFRFYRIEFGNLADNKINYVHEDKEGNTWILTGGGLTRIWAESNETRSFVPDSGGAFLTVLEQPDRIWFGSSNGYLWSYDKNTEDYLPLYLCSFPVRNLVLRDEKLLAATTGDGLFLIDPADFSFHQFHTGNSALNDNRIHSLHTDPFKNVWVETAQSGIMRLDPDSDRFTHYVSVPDSLNYRSASVLFGTDRENRVWIRPRDGVFSFYDPDSKELTPFHETPFSPHSDYPSDIYCFFFDNQNNLWVSSASKGLDRIVFPTQDFQLIRPAPEGGKFSNDVRTVMVDSRKRLWVSSRDGRIRIFDRNGNYQGVLSRDGTIGHGPPLAGLTYCIHEDREQNVWIGTRQDGVYLLTPDRNGYRVHHFKRDSGDEYSLNSNSIYSIRTDSHGNVWIGTWGGGIQLAERTGRGGYRFIHPGNLLVDYPWEEARYIRYISEEKDGKIFAGTNSGLLVFDTRYENPQDIRFRHYTQGDGGAGTITHGDIHHICRTETGTFLATAGGGINYVRQWDERGFPVDFGSFTRKDGLPSDNIISLVATSDGIIWVTTENNITRFDPKTENFKTFSTAGKLLGNGLFWEGSSFLTDSGILYQGSTEGIFQFNPIKMPSGSFVPRIVFTGFSLDNNTVPVGGTPLYSRHVDVIDRLTLAHKDKIFGIDFAALDFNGPENLRYAYKLEGVDPDWVYPEGIRTAGYMNLPKGKYVLTVRSTNAEGTWVDNDRKLLIEVLPSFWQTGWGYAVIFLLLCSFIYLTAYILFTIYRLKNRVSMEAKLAEAKLRFFTDISHEIRTPLTLISSPVDQILHDEATPGEIRKKLRLVSGNTKRLLQMVNQVLDFRRTENRRLRIEPIDPEVITRNLCLNFRQAARDKGIDLIFTSDTHGATLWADRDGYEKIVVNLLSNAVKFTPQEGTVRVELLKEETGVILQVSDSGIGMDEKELPLIFNRFHTSGNNRTDSPGSGIGLALVKELVEKHHGNIRVESRPGKGTKFTVGFREGYDHFGTEADIISLGPDTNTEKNTPFRPENGKERDTILVVEDDEELREFIRSVLEETYHVITAENGKYGYESAMNHIPDLIVSDVMMPELDGISMLGELRNNLATSHIPVILLTAKGDTENKIEGLDVGADDYIVKPFEVPYLQSRVHNLLDQRKRLQQIYSTIPFMAYENTGTKNAASGDMEFIRQLIVEIENHLDDGNYSIEDLSGNFGINRTAFYRKVKSLTGMAPVEFVRDIRLQNAAKLLKSGNYKVKEVVYMVGFSDPKYFTKSFKEKYGVPPSRFGSRD